MYPDSDSIQRLGKLPKLVNWLVIISVVCLSLCSDVITQAQAESFRQALKLSQLQVNSVPFSQPETLSESSSISLKQVKVLGSTVFSEEDLDKITVPFIGKEVTLETLEEIARQITQLYVANGYLTSGAYLPPQDLSNGVVTIQVIEGKLEDIEIQGLNRLQNYYVRERLMKAVTVPLNIKRLEQALQLLQLDPLFERIEAELNQGTEPELSILTIKLKEAPAISIGLQFDNYESPSIGEYRGTLKLHHQNLLGFGDQLSAEYRITEGQDQYDFSYGVPLNANNGTLSISYQTGDTKIIEDVFKDVGIRAESNTLSLSFRQPVILKPNEELALSISWDLKESRTFLLNDIPYSFTLGPENGKSRVTALRLGQEWINRSPKRVLAARSYLSFGLGLFDATINEIGIDGRFFSWQGEFQWVEKLDEDIIFLARFGMQLTPDALLPVEQFDIGGIDTVRGYANNLRIGDNGIVGTIETRFTVFNNDTFGVIELVPFFDIGTVWNNKLATVNPNTLASTGLGLRWQINNLNLRLDYGIPLIKIEQQGNSLQENEFSFSILWQQRF
ncbi:ShlB/FhaC/HecB family hemolysin secretion/activation protein [Aphanothece hegewaldii CCALA 016]|uniref:ShlB/FhaC/HecB family hemolysin secretion/activation protein n=1 Tax=Aphanothece hegewaldii CCALA 016 TaxID=2107694 RepID=A0A2T1LT33_9CHRO|nr:ShlB/FhaC/HecB family hemolysin secretion/activation protein [Aphanothece hegewaldii]PSF33314.1 ShlB/FhaC/HecB family hemolysin secretion/activation protein [Aphanothece hegewaldii CCALA 016]